MRSGPPPPSQAHRDCFVVCFNRSQGQSPASTLISQRSDIVWSESCSLQDRVSDWHSLWTGRPAMNAWSSLMYKVGLSSGDWNKPVWYFADDCSNPTMAELWQAEGISNGGACAE
jgi:hypothetical protein